MNHPFSSLHRYINLSTRDNSPDFANFRAFHTVGFYSPCLCGKVRCAEIVFHFTCQDLMLRYELWPPDKAALETGTSVRTILVLSVLLLNSFHMFSHFIQQWSKWCRTSSSSNPVSIRRCCSADRSSRSSGLVVSRL